MDIAHNSPILILSFNRPDYLRTVLESLRLQKGAHIEERQVALFQDGATNPISKRTYAEQADLEACVTVFKEILPHGIVFPSDTNLGIALNFDRAERHAFEILNAAAAIFLEDDLVLSENYIAILDQLLAINFNDKRVGYVAAYGDHTLPREAQIINQHRLTTMHHNWGFGLYRRQWEAMRPHVREYLALVRNSDYRLRDHGAITKLFASWGFGTPATSQDAAKTLACSLLRTIKVNTSACFARYIGEKGVHMNANDFRAQNYGATYVFPCVVTSFEPVSENLYHQIRADLVHWAGRVAGTTSETSQRKAARQLFHATNDHARAGQHVEAVRTATAALIALFSSASTGREVRPGFYPMANIRDQRNESHVRFDLRGNTLRILCTNEIITPQFTNYFHAFVLAAALLEAVLATKPPDGGLTMDLGNGSNVGTYRRIAFSSALPQAELVIDPEFFVSGGYTEIREIFAKAWKPWREREDKAFWRGQSTGIQTKAPGPGESHSWGWLQRLHLCEVARKSVHAPRLNVGLSQVVQIKAPHLLDAIAATHFLLGPEAERELVQYRYVFVLDSNNSTGNGLFQALLAGCCVLLVESRFGFRSWYYDRLVAGQTHVAVKADLSDLDQHLNWVFENPEECERIAQRGRALAESMSYQAEFQLSVERMKTCFRP
ncbi:MAG: hypothetical protein ACLPTF_00600 [Steroidobacteraceae bacterium]